MVYLNKEIAQFISFIGQKAMSGREFYFKWNLCQLSCKATKTFVG